MTALFAGTTFLVVDSPDNSYSALWIQNIITRNGGAYVKKTPPHTLGAIESLHIGHIISSTYDFPEYARATELMVPVTSPQWLEDSQLALQRRNYRLYSPVPLPFMDRVVLCIADNLPDGDRDMIYGGVRAFGGQYLDALSRYTTHLVAVDLSNNKSVVAANIKKKEGLEIKIVLPHWIDDCFKQQRHVREDPYLLSDPVVLQTGKPNFRAVVEEESDHAAPAAPKTDVLKLKAVYLSGDYRLSEHLVNALTTLVELCGGSIVSEFDLQNIDVYLGKYREGDEFRQCCNDASIDVGSLLWLYYIATRKQYIAPLRSHLLHFPVPNLIIPEFQNLRISVTGYSGDARHYLSQLIVAMGATFTKTLDSHNDFLVTAKSSGEKYDAVKTRWPNVVLVNHLWIEEGFVKWKYMDPTSERYSRVDKSTQILGQAHLVKHDLVRWTKDGSEALDVEDSLNEDNHRDLELPERQAMNLDTRPSASATESPVLSPADDNGSQHAEQNEIVDKEKVQTIHSDGVDLVEVHQVVDVPTQVQGRAGRSAKMKAEMKLHSDMEDLNQYTSMSKSARKMKTYMEELDKSVGKSSSKRGSEKTDHAETPSKKAKTESPKPAKKKSEKAVHMVAIMTGCEQELALNRSEIVKLSKVGIQIVNDVNNKKAIDTVIAPRVLRTEKFLISISKASQILHPSYLVDILNRITHSEVTWPELNKEFNVENYYLDRVVPVKQINQDLGVKGSQSGLQNLLRREHGLVFNNLKLNLSTNLNGGAALIAGILEAHGLQDSKQIKLSASTTKSSLLVNDDEKRILIAHKVRDKKLVSGLKDVISVEWDWCVKSIFQGKLEDYSKYIVGK